MERAPNNPQKQKISIALKKLPGEKAQRHHQDTNSKKTISSTTSSNAKEPFQFAQSKDRFENHPQNNHSRRIENHFQNNSCFPFTFNTSGEDQGHPSKDRFNFCDETPTFHFQVSNPNFNSQWRIGQIPNFNAGYSDWHQPVHRSHYNQQKQPNQLSSESRHPTPLQNQHPKRIQNQKKVPSNPPPPNHHRKIESCINPEQRPPISKPFQINLPTRKPESKSKFHSVSSLMEANDTFFLLGQESEKESKNNFGEKLSKTKSAEEEQYFTGMVWNLPSEEGNSAETRTNGDYFEQDKEMVWRIPNSPPQGTQDNDDNYAQQAPNHLEDPKEVTWNMPDLQNLPSQQISQKEGIPLKQLEVEKKGTLASIPAEPHTSRQEIAPQESPKQDKSRNKTTQQIEQTLDKIKSEEKQQSLPASRPFSRLVGALKMLNEKFSDRQQTQMQQNVILELKLSKMTAQLQNELEQMKLKFDKQKEKSHQIQIDCQTKIRVESNSLQHQCRRYMQAVADKETELQSLHKLNATLKNKLTSAEKQIASLNSLLQNQEVLVKNNQQQLKNLLKQSIREIDTAKIQKSALQGLYEKNLVKLKDILDFNEEKDKRIQLLKQQNKKLNKQLDYVQQSYLDVSFQLEQAKTQRNFFQFDSQSEVSGVNFKHFLKEHFSKQAIYTGSKEDYIEYASQQLHQVHQSLSTNFSKGLNFQKNLQSAQQMLYEARNTEAILKKKLRQKQNELDELRCERDSSRVTQVIKRREPGVYQYLLKKKSEVQQFENSLGQVIGFVSQNESKINLVLKSFLGKKGESKETQTQEIRIECLTQERVAQKRQTADTNNQKGGMEQEIASWGRKLNKANTKIAQQITLREEADELITHFRSEIVDLLENKKKRRHLQRCSYCFLGKTAGPLNKCSKCQKLYHSRNYCNAEHQCSRKEDTQ